MSKYIRVNSRVYRAIDSDADRFGNSPAARDAYAKGAKAFRILAEKFKRAAAALKNV